MSLFGKRENAASDVHKLADQDDTVHTVLMFHKGLDISKQEEYVYKFHHQRLPALKPNQISISGIKLTRVEDDVIIVAFLRNSINKAVRFDIVDLLLVDGDGKFLAKKDIRSHRAW
ncbi:SLAP domain-containing protein [Peribacillus frigoritolerans]|nr:SLAP domain-containing protein [Peribacillus frigoritolerans]